jgi:hypothetical protein
MIELRLLANDRQHCGRCAPGILMKRVAGLAFNFSLTDMNPPSTAGKSTRQKPGTVTPKISETLPSRASGL